MPRIFADDVEAANALAQSYKDLRNEMAKVIVGQDDVFQPYEGPIFQEPRGVKRRIAVRIPKYRPGHICVCIRWLPPLQCRGVLAEQAVHAFGKHPVLIEDLIAFVKLEKYR